MLRRPIRSKVRIFCSIGTRKSITLCRSAQKKCWCICPRLCKMVNPNRCRQNSPTCDCARTLGVETFRPAATPGGACLLMVGTCKASYSGYLTNIWLFCGIMYRKLSNIEARLEIGGFIKSGTSVRVSHKVQLSLTLYGALLPVAIVLHSDTLTKCF